MNVADLVLSCVAFIYILRTFLNVAALSRFCTNLNEFKLVLKPENFILFLLLSTRRAVFSDTHCMPI